MEPVRENVAAVLAALDPRADASSATVRLAALAWLVFRGLRRTACCTAVSAVPGVEAAFGAAVDFEVRAPGFGADAPFWLSDDVVLYAPGARAELSPVWAEHRRAYSQGIALGRALGYFAPRERLSDTEACQEVRLVHLVALPGGLQVGLWVEGVGASPDFARLAGYLHSVGLALGEIGLAHAFELEKRG